MQNDDIAGVVALAAEEATAPHWPVAEYYRMLDGIAESPARRGAWVLLPRPGAAARQPVLGFAMASHVAGTCDLEAVVVHADWRGRGWGGALVDAAAAWGARLRASRLQLEVRDSNAAALRLYRRKGFSIDGRRPGYYRNPEEAAVLMSLALGPGGDAAIV